MLYNRDPYHYWDPNFLYGNRYYGDRYYGDRVFDDRYNYERRVDDRPVLDYVPRKRPSLYPAIPYTEPPASGRKEVDVRRARFEITVPTADTIIWFDGGCKLLKRRRIEITA